MPYMLITKWDEEGRPIKFISGFADHKSASDHLDAPFSYREIEQEEEYEDASTGEILTRTVKKQIVNETIRNVFPDAVVAEEPVEPLEDHIVSGGVLTSSPKMPTERELKEYAAERRWKSEVAGTTITTPKGKVIPLPTDRETRSTLKQARDILRDGELVDKNDATRTTAKVVINDYHAELTDAQMTGLLKAIAKHVQLAFDVQAKVMADIEAGTVTTLAQIDAYEWPR